jgi:hypothetical protein
MGKNLNTKYAKDTKCTKGYIKPSFMLFVPFVVETVKISPSPGSEEGERMEGIG